MTNFNWFSEEEVGWDEQKASTPQPKRPRRWLRWLLIVAIVGVGTGTAVTMFYRQLANRVDEVSFELKASIRDSHAIVYKAAEQSDRDLFVTFLSGRDDVWAAEQERVVDDGLLFRRHGFGLAWLPEDANTAVSAIEIDPTLTAAVVTTTHHYAIGVGNGLTQTVTFLQTAVYRQGPDRWLFSPADESFWGDTESSRGELLTVTYPARDTAVAQRLAADLEAKLNEMCGRLADINCPPDMHIAIDLTTSPISLYETNKLPGNLTLTAPPVRSFGWYSFPTHLTDEHVLTLPTPTLFGLPLDEAAYQAMFRGYAARVVSAVITELSGWECCDNQAVIFQVLLDTQLAQLGLKAWPVQPSDYGAVLGTPIFNIYDHWHLMDDLEEAVTQDQTDLYLMVEFLTREAGVSAAALEQILPRNAEGVFSLFQQDYPTLPDLERAWTGYLYGRSQSAQTPPPIPFPDETLYLACQPADGSDGLLYQFNPATQDLMLTRALAQRTAVLFPLPDRSGLIVAEQGNGSGLANSTFIWQSTQERLIARNLINQQPVPIPLSASPDGTRLLLDSQNGSAAPYVLLNLPGCLQGDECDLQALLGATVWSPDGQQAILRGGVSGAVEDNLLFWADEDGRNAQLIGQGKTPVWLDNQTVIFVQENRSVMQVDAATLEVTPVVDITTLSAELDTPTGNNEGATIEFVVPSPTDPDVLYLAIGDPLGFLDSNYLIRYKRSSGEIELLLDRGRESVLYARSYTVSPDGRWLAQIAFINDPQAWQLYLTDLETGDTQQKSLAFLPQQIETVPTLSWSADGQWTAVISDGYVRLLLLGYDYERWFIPQHMACNQAVWLK